MLLALLFFSSGFASLVDEVLFSRLLQFSFGVSIFATTAVVAAFLAGLGLGAFVMAAPSRRSRRPTLVYGLLEVGVGLIVPVFPYLAKGLTPLLASLFSGLEPNSFAFGIARFGAAFGFLLIPSFLMGGTLPFLIRSAVREDSPRRAAGVGLFYGINTLGAGLGALLSGYLFLPSLGYGKTILLSAGVSIAVGIVAIAVGWRETVSTAPAAPNGTDRDEPGASSAAGALISSPNAGRFVMPVAVAFGGVVSLSSQILWTRVLINVFGGSVYAFSLVLAVFLCALALGSVIVPALLSRMGDPTKSLALLFALSAAATGAGLLIFRAWLGLDGPLGDAYNLYPEAGETFATTFTLYAALAGVAVGPSVFFLGAVLPFAAGVWAQQGALSRFTGRLYALSSLGSIIGSLVGAFVLLPLLSAEGGVLTGACLSFAVGGALWASARKKNLLVASGIGAACLVLVVASSIWRPAAASSVKTLFFDEGPAATAKVESFLNDDGDTILSLRVNGKVVATTGFLDRRLQLLLGYCATLSHRDPQKILSVGLGTGMSSGALAAHGPERFEIVELSGSVVGAAGEFSEYNHGITRDRATIIIADGRNHLLLTKESYDLIAADPIHPWVAGSGNLYTVEYFKLAASRLTAGGVMGQWVPLYQLTARDVRSVLATFHAVFDSVRVFYTGYDLVVVGSKSPLFFDPLEWKERIRRPTVAQDLASIGIDDLADLLACFLFTETGLGAFLEMGDFTVNRDANQTLEYSAPMSLWRPYDTNLIMELLDAAEGIHALAPAEYWPLGADLAASERQAAYADRVRVFFEEIAQNIPGARKRFREGIGDL